LVGPTFVPLQAELKRVWGSRFPILFSSGCSMLSCAQHLNPNNKIFENDVSSYDASICEDLGKLEIWLAKKFGAYRAVLDLMQANLKTHGYTSTGIKYKVNGTRKSGDPYTSFFNSILNGLMHIFCFVEGGSDLTDVLSGVKMLVQGDDNLLSYDCRLEPRWQSLLELGFKCDNIVRENYSEAEFCSNILYPTGKGYCFGPKLGRVVSKLGCFQQPPLKIPYRSILSGMAIGMEAFSSYIPCFRIFQKLLIRLSEGAIPFFLKNEEWRMNAQCCPFLYEAWSVSEKRYYLDPDNADWLSFKMDHVSIGEVIDEGIIELLFDKEFSTMPLIYN